MTPLPLAHLAVANAALLVFDSWNAHFPSPVGYCMNGERQVYWDVCYTFDKFQHDGHENCSLYKFAQQLNSVATSYDFLGRSSINIVGKTIRYHGQHIKFCHVWDWVSCSFLKKNVMS